MNRGRSHARLCAMLRRRTPEQRALNALKEMSPPDGAFTVQVQDVGPWRVAVDEAGKPLDMVSQVLFNSDQLDQALDQLVALAQKKAGSDDN